MPDISLFSGLTEQDVKYLLNFFKAQKITCKKDSIIITNIKNTNTIGYIEDGEAAIIRYEYNGNRTVIEHIENKDTFGKFFTSDNNNDLSIKAISDTKIILFDYEYILKNYKSNNEIQNKFLNNIFISLSNQLEILNEHMNILSKRTIRDKLLEYFNNLSLKTLSKTIYLPFTYTMFADYLGVDRCAMMRELKNMKDDGLIVTYGKKIIIKY